MRVYQFLKIKISRDNVATCCVWWEL